jgi:hypothetical protein
MSITRCPICDNEYDQDFEVEHEEMCREMNEVAVSNLNKLNKQIVGFYCRYNLLSNEIIHQS